MFSYRKAHQSAPSTSSLVKRNTAPLPALPAETLGLIFEYCLVTCDPSSVVDLDHFLDGIPLIDRFKTAPWRLGAVCRAWRYAAWGTPQLWTTIVVNMRRSPRSLIQEIPHWINRTGALPLTLVFHDGDVRVRGTLEDRQRGLFPVSMPEEYYSRVVAPFVPHAARWKCLVLGPMDAVDRFVKPLAKFNACFPSLKSVAIHSDHLKEALFSDLATIFPSPENLVVAAGGSSVNTIGLTPMYNNLRCISLHMIVDDDVLLALAHMDNLVECRLHAIRQGTSSDVRQVTHRRLEILKLFTLPTPDASFDGACDMLLCALTLPALRELSVDSRSRPNLVGSLVERSKKGKLDVLEIYLHKFIPAFQVLDYIPHLRELLIYANVDENCALSDVSHLFQTFSSIAFGPQKPAAFNSLERVAFMLTGPNEEPIRAITAMCQRLDNEAAFYLTKYPIISTRVPQSFWQTTVPLDSWSKPLYPY